MILGALVAAEVAALVLAVAGHRIRPRSYSATSVINPAPNSDRVLVALLAFALANEVTFAALHRALDGAARPFVGWRRVGYHVSVALSLGWPAALAAAAWRAFGATKGERPEPKSEPSSCPDRALPPMRGRGARSPSTSASRVPDSTPIACAHSLVPRGAAQDELPQRTDPRALGPAKLSSTLRALLAPVNGSRRTHPTDILAAVYLGAVVGLAGCYPLPRGMTAHVLTVWQVACVGLAVLAIARAWRRPWSRAAVCVGLLVAVELTLTVLGPWAHDVFRDWQRLARVPYLFAFGALAVVMGVWWRRGRAG